MRERAAEHLGSILGASWEPRAYRALRCDRVTFPFDAVRCRTSLNVHRGHRHAEHDHAEHDHDGHHEHDRHHDGIQQHQPLALEPLAFQLLFLKLLPLNLAAASATSAVVRCT